ncbi:hypothetical protein [uncultured Dokdonia sp.]|uniref:hypothetical protein n=1 Tax=uncultured Dokdonia sp. TaxID=575653 RepID=UPI002615F5A0|nr:hypothetical protein [uncultured Dokdonia sp.]
MNNWTIICFVIVLVSALACFGNVSPNYVGTARVSLLLFATLLFISIIRGSVKR